MIPPSVPWQRSGRREPSRDLPAPGASGSNAPRSAARRWIGTAATERRTAIQRGGTEVPDISKTRLAELRKLIAAGKENLFYEWPEWLRTRAWALYLDRGECTRCKQRGRYTPAEVVHHVQHLRDRPDLALSIYDEDGKRQLVSLCRACHEHEHPERLRPAWTAKQKEELTKERWD